MLGSALTATVGGTATVAAGTYYITGLLSTIAAAFAASSGTSCTVTASLGENGTGIVTITFGSATAITWISTDLRDILGFTGNSSSATVHTSTQAVRGAWMPDVAYDAPNTVSSSFKGDIRSDRKVVMSANGNVFSVAGQFHYELTVAWPAVKVAKVRIAQETTVNQSFERFWRDFVLSEPSWGSTAPVRFYPDADSGSFVQYSLLEPSDFAPQRLREDWAGGPHRIEIKLAATGS